MDDEKHLYARYIADIKKYARISEEREVELSRVIMTSGSDQEVDMAVKELVHANLLIAVEQAQEWSWAVSHNSRMTVMDLISEANAALVSAARKFDAEQHQVGFYAYAAKAIKNRILNAIGRSRFVPVPSYHLKYLTILHNMIQENGSLPSDRSIRKAFAKLEKSASDISSKVLDRLKMEAQLQFVSTEDNPEMDTASASNGESPVDEVIRYEVSQDISDAIDSLPDREKEVIIRHYFHEESFSAIASDMNLTRQRIQRIKVEAEAKLARIMRKKERGY